MYVNKSIKSTHCERVRFQGSNSMALFTFKNLYFSTSPHLELILFPLWYWPMMNAHTKQQQDKVFETDFIESKTWPPICAPFGSKSRIYICEQVSATHPLHPPIPPTISELLYKRKLRYRNVWSTLCMLILQRRNFKAKLLDRQENIKKIKGKKWQIFLH